VPPIASLAPPGDLRSVVCAVHGSEARRGAALGLARRLAARLSARPHAVHLVRSQPDSAQAVVGLAEEMCADMIVTAWDREGGARGVIEEARCPVVALPPAGQPAVE
jgi:hypothetical protein